MTKKCEDMPPLAAQWCREYEAEMYAKGESVEVVDVDFESIVGNTVSTTIHPQIADMPEDEVSDLYDKLFEVYHGHPADTSEWDEFQKLNLCDKKERCTSLFELIVLRQDLAQSNPLSELDE